MESPPTNTGPTINHLLHDSWSPPEPVVAEAAEESVGYYVSWAGLLWFYEILATFYIVHVQ